MSLTVSPVGQRHGVVHLPENIELELEHFDRALLCRARAAALERQRQAVLDVAARPAHAALEVCQPRGLDPRVMLRPRGEALAVNLGCEELGQGCAHAVDAYVSFARRAPWLEGVC